MSASEVMIGSPEKLALVAIKGPPKASSNKAWPPMDGRNPPIKRLLADSTILGPSSRCSSNKMGFADELSRFSSVSPTMQYVLISTTEENRMAKGFSSRFLILRNADTAFGLNGSAISWYPPMAFIPITPPFFRMAVAVSSQGSGWTSDAPCPFPAVRTSIMGPQSWQEMVCA